MNEILLPVAQILSAVDGHRDFAIILYRECTSLLHFMDFTYDANKIARLRNANDTVPCSTVGIANAPNKLLHAMSELLLQPELPYIFKKVLELGGKHNIKLPLVFMSRIQEDLAAHVEGKPLPSYYLPSPPSLAALKSFDMHSDFSQLPLSQPSLPQHLEPTRINMGPTFTHAPYRYYNSLTRRKIEVDEMCRRLGSMGRSVQEANHNMYRHDRFVEEEKDRLVTEGYTISAIVRAGMMPSSEATDRISAMLKNKLSLEDEKQAVERQERSIQRKLGVEKRLRSRQERCFATPGLRAPEIGLVGHVPKLLCDEAEATIHTTDPNQVLTTTIGGIPLKLHDFKTLVPSTSWLNDEIVNGTFGWLDEAINKTAGIQDVKKQTRKCLSLSSLFVSQLEKNISAGERALRRQGVTKDNILDVETILLPVCAKSHWTLLAIFPSRKVITHVDPLLEAPNIDRAKLALSLMKVVLKEQFMEDEWAVETILAPRQRNGYDCGVFTISNGICLALKLNPSVAYSANEMREQRLKIAAILLNRGFSGEFDLSQY